MTNEYRSLKDHVYNHIVDLIDGGTLADDHKISEQQICDALGVSRTPIREALRRLEVEDLPAFVIIDSEGNNLYETGRKEYLESIR